MQRRTALSSTLLVASLTANVVLWRHTGSQPPPAAPGPVARAAGSPPSPPAARATSVVARPIPASMAACATRRQELSARLEAARRKLAADGAPAAILASAQPNDEAKARVVEVVNRILEANGSPDTDSSVECRGTACQVVLLGPDPGSAEAAAQRLSREPSFRGLFAAISRESGLEVRDAAGQTSHRYSLLARLR